MDWLRARMHLFAPVALVPALAALAMDWLLGAHTRQETLVYAGLGLGGLGLLALKLSTLKRRRDD
jgi:3-oxoacyl-(acyl-carrier-protein) synthase